MTFRRHVRALLNSWSEETARRRVGRTWEQADFLPAALEVTEAPPSPLGRAIIWTIMAAAAVALTWACLSEVDTVAVAEGRLTPTGRLRTVEAADAGIVRAIPVREGDRVVAGQLLMSLDATVAEADAKSAQTEYDTAALVRARASALLGSLSGTPARVIGPPGANPAAVRAEQAAVDARVAAYTEKRGVLEQRRAAARATVRMTEAAISKIEQSLPLANQQVQAYQVLSDKGFGSRLRLAQEQERLIGLRQDLIAERARRDESAAQVASLTREIAEAAQDFRAHAAREGAEAEGTIATRGDELRKAAQRHALQTLRAPVSGTVQEISITTLGQMAQPGKALITIVPDGEALVAEVFVLDKDAGAVRNGDPAVVKLQAYPFTRYGTLQGRLARISPDSVVDEKRGLVFPAIIVLDPVSPGGKSRLALSPGMSVAAEIVTGRRKVIEYLWSPVARAVSEAGRER